MRTQSLGCEAELVAHGFHAPLHDGATACDFVAKLSELRSVAHGFQLKEVTRPVTRSRRGFHLLFPRGIGVKDSAATAQVLQELLAAARFVAPTLCVCENDATYCFW
jgi:hypothetical protein